MDTNHLSQELLQAFAEESREILQRLEKEIMAMEHESKSEQMKMLANIRGDLHTLKGAATAVGFEDMKEVSHTFEDLVNHFLQQKVKIGSEALDIFLETLQFLDSISRGEEQISKNEIMQKLFEASMIGEDIPEEEPAANVVAEPEATELETTESKQVDQTHEQESLQEASTTESTQSSAVQSSTQETGQKKAGWWQRIFSSGDNNDSSVQGQETELRSPEAQPSQSLSVATTEAKKTAMSLTPQPSVAAPSPKPKEVKQQPTQEQPINDNSVTYEERESVLSGDSNEREEEKSIRVDTIKLDQLQSGIEELVVLNLQQKDLVGQATQFQNNLQDLFSQWRQMQTFVRENRNIFPKKQWQKMDNMLASFNQKIKATTRTSYQINNFAASTSRQLGFVNDALEEKLKSIRMLPIEPYLQSFARVVRDSARSTQKKVKLEVNTENAEVDRLVLDHLREPLIHLLRNAVAHGIEAPERRKRNGKEEFGTISLEASIEGEKVSLRVIDNGHGFDYDAIQKKALKLGLIKSRSDFDESKILEILSHPGFSTAKSVSDVAGRGMGMDVVVENVLSIKGTIEAQSIPGEGCCFFLEIPSRLSTSQGLILKYGNYQFGISFDSVRHILRTRPGSIQKLQNVDVIYLEESPITIVSLASLLGMPEISSKGTNFPTIVIEHGDARLAIMVEDIPGEIPMVIKPFGSQFQNISHFTGGAIQSDGSVLPILDARQLILKVQGKESLYRVNIQEEAGEIDSENEEAKETITVLVVDDSITTRTMERNILESAGYRVLVATDGEEAFEVLKTQEEIDLLITDLEMPRMNGLELCRTVRASNNFSDIPIIMVTSVEAQQQQGLEAGADAYIIKGNFHQDHFLTTVRRLCG